MYRTIQRRLSSLSVGQEVAWILGVRLGFRRLNHLRNREIFKCDEIEIIYEAATELVSSVTSLILDLAVEASDRFDLSLSSVAAALHACKSTLRIGQSALRFRSEVFANI